MTTPVPRLLAALAAVYPACRRGALLWPAFVALMRHEDVLASLTGGKHRPSRINVLAGLDICQDAFLPSAVSAPLSFDESVLPRWHREPYQAFKMAAEMLFALLAEVSSQTVSGYAFFAAMLERVYAHHRRGDAAQEAALSETLAEMRALLCDSDAAGEPEQLFSVRLPREKIILPNVSPANPKGRLSVSLIDAYLHCPFTYLIEGALGMRRVHDRDYVGPEILGTLVHAALARYAALEYARLADGAEPQRDEAAIATDLLAAYAAETAHYGALPRADVREQLAAGAQRLVRFARIQAFWVRDGWRIAAPPEYAFNLHPFAGEEDVDYPFKGSVDRIDYKEGVGYRVIDYKTWEYAEGAWSRIVDGTQLKSVQLLLYGKCLALADPARFAGKIVDYCYALLGGSERDTVVLGSAFPQGAFAYRGDDAMERPLVAFAEQALETTRGVIRRIAANVFDSPSPDAVWRRTLWHARFEKGRWVLPVADAVLDLLSLAEHPEDRAAWMVVHALTPLRESVFPDRTSAATVSSALAGMLSWGGLDGALAEIAARLRKSPIRCQTERAMADLTRAGSLFVRVCPLPHTIKAFRKAFHDWSSHYE